MNIGKIISEQRKNKGLTQEELGKKLKVSSSTISSWERNITEPSEKELKKLSEILNVDLIIDEEESTSLKTIFKCLYILILTIAPALYFYKLSTELLELLLTNLNNSGSICSSNIAGMKATLLQALIIPYGYYTISIVSNYIFTKCQSKYAFPIALVIETAFFIEVGILTLNATSLTADMFLFLVPALTGIIQYAYITYKNRQ